MHLQSQKFWPFYFEMKLCGNFLSIFGTTPTFTNSQPPPPLSQHFNYKCPSSKYCLPPPSPHPQTITTPCQLLPSHNIKHVKLRTPSKFDIWFTRWFGLVYSRKATLQASSVGLSIFFSFLYALI